MSSLKIAIVSTYYPWPPSIGGVETIVRNVSTELGKRGHQVHVVTTPFDATTMERISEYGVEEKDGVIIHNLKLGRLRIGYAGFLKELKDAIREIAPDVLHSHNLHPHLFQAAKWKEQLGFRVVAELHHPAVTIDHFAARLVFPIVVYNLLRAQIAVDAFVAHTLMEMRWLVDKGIPASKVHKVMFPGVSQMLIDYVPKRQLFSENIVLFVGRLKRVKAVHILIQAMAKVVEEINDTSLWLVGPEDEKYRKSMNRLIDELGLGSHVAFKGPLFGEELYECMANSLILILPSLMEYTPSVVLEAQALGLPVIATRVGALPELVLHGETGFLIKPNNPDELAEATVALITNGDLRAKISVNARSFAREFILERSVDNLEELYHGFFR